MRHLFRWLMCLAFTMLPTLANAFEIGEYIYTVTDSVKRTVSLNTKHPSYMTTNVNITGNVNIPSKVEYDGVEYTVTAIENDAFCYFKRVTSVTIPNTVTSIGDNSFAYCENLVDITIPNSVISIGENAFAHCTGLSSITIPNSVTTIGINAFFNCYSLTEVNIPNSVKTIGNGAFQRCMGLTSVTIPNSITSLEGVFIDCTGLTSVTIPNSVTSMNRTFSGCTGLSSVVIPNSVTSMDETFVRCTKLTSITIPNSVTSMDGTFSGCTGLTSVVIPNSVTSMNGTFFNCTGLTSVVIPNSVTSMNGTFRGCTGLTSANIPDSVTTINSAFRECTKLTNITIPSSVTSIEAAFCGCTGLTSVIIPKSVTSIGDFTFEGCSQLTSVEIPESVTSIGSSAFNGCSQLASIEIPEAVSLIGYNAFTNCKSLPELIIPDSVATIRDYAFSGTECTVYYGGKATGGPWGAKKLIRGSVIDGDFVYADKQKTKLVAYLGSDSVITIPDNVKTIAEKAFSNSTELTSVVIPESVTSIEKQAFYGCTGLKSIVIPDAVSTIGAEAFYNVKRIYYGGAATGSPWGANFHVRGSVFCGDFVYADEQKTKLVFYNGTDSVVTIPDHVRIIGERAFIGNIGITSVSIPDSVTTIETSAFYGCENLTSVNMPSALTTIGDYAFETCQNCRTLSDIILPNSVTSIGRSAFSRVERLYYAGTATGSSWRAKWHIRGNVFDGDFIYADEQKTILAGYIGSDSIVDIPNQVKTIGIGAFLQNQKLYSVNMSNSVVTIEENAFRECSNLTYVALSDSITSIGQYAFWMCKGMTLFHIPKSVKTIGPYAFTGIITICYDGDATGSPWDAKQRIRSAVYDGEFIYMDEKKTDLVAYIGNDIVVTIPDQVKTIHEYAFYNNKKITNVIFPDSLISIKNHAFYGCDHLSIVVVPNNVDTIGYYAFNGTGTLCYGGNAKGSWGEKRRIRGSFIEEGLVYADEAKTKLVAYIGTDSVVDIPESVTSIDANTFNGSETVYYAGTATGSPWGAKEHIKSYIDGDYIYTDKGKTKIAVYTGSDSVVVIPKQVKTIGDNVFNGNTKLISVTLPDSITSIGNNAFSGCTGISSLTIPVSVTSIGKNAFSGIDTIYYQTENGTILIIKDFYVIHNLQEFVAYRNINNKGYHPNGRLDADIDLSPICGIINGEIVNWETLDLGNAMFDGGNHTISNLYINKPGYMVSLFKSWHIENLTVKNAYVKGTDAAGITSCTSPLLLVNCHFEGVVIGTDFACGLNLYGKASTLVNCSNYGLVVGGKNAAADGIYAQEPINCYNRGRIVSNESTAKGVGMYCCCNPTNCYNAGAIISTEAYSIYEAYKSCFNLKIEGINLHDEETVQEMDSSAFLSGAVTDSLNKYVAQYPKTYTYYAGTIEDTIPLLPWVQGEDGFPRFEGVDLQPTQGYIVRFTGKVNNIEVSLDGTINLPVCPVDGCTYVFSNDFDGKNIVSDTTVTVSQITDPNFLERDGDGFYLIHNGAELARFRDVVNEGAVTINGRLANDIDLSQECKDSVWIPIGFNKNGRDYIAFEGVFDGAGHSIEHLYNITDSPYQGESTHWYRGLFGNTKNATIQNVVVKNSRITGFCVSAIVASAENTTIVNCGSEAELYGYSDHGAASMCAIMERNTKVINCYNLGVVGGEYQAAAIACHAYGNPELVNCYSSAIITLNYRSGNEETGPFCQVEHCVRCFTDSVICNFNYEREGVTKTSTDYIKSDAFLTDMNAWVDSMNAAQSEFVFAHWVRDEVDGYPKLQPADSSSVSTKEQPTTPEGISVYAVEGTIYIRSAHAGKATLYDIHGKAVASVAYKEGLTTVDGLREGVYIVCGVKVIVHRGK